MRDKVDAEGWSARKRGIEEVDGEVGGDAAIRKPDRLQVLDSRSRVALDGIELHRRHQERKADGEASPEEDRKVLRRGKEVKIRGTWSLVAHANSEAVRLAGTHGCDDAFRQNQRKFALAEVERPFKERQPCRPAPGQVRCHEHEIDIA